MDNSTANKPTIDSAIVDPNKEGIVNKLFRVINMHPLFSIIFSIVVLAGVTYGISLAQDDATFKGRLTNRNPIGYHTVEVENGGELSVSLRDKTRKSNDEVRYTMSLVSDTNETISTVNSEAKGSNLRITEAVTPGFYTIQVGSLDELSSRGSRYRIKVVFPEESIIKEDTTKPSLTISGPAYGSIVTNTFQLTGSANDNTVVEQVAARINDGDWKVAEDPYNWSIDFDTTKYTNGEYVITIEVVDEAGNKLQQEHLLEFYNELPSDTEPDPDPDPGTDPESEDPEVDPEADPDQDPSSSTNPGVTSVLGECLNRNNVEVLSSTYTDRVKFNDHPDDFTIDARNGISLTNGVRALEVGENNIPDNLCLLGWSVYGQQSRTLSWREMHDDVGGSALRVYGSNYIVDGLRAENVEDAFDPRGGEGFEVRNMWVEYIRDDCIENDELREGIVRDSLFDGCYTFFSEQEDGSAEGESLIFENVLVRLQPMPKPRNYENSSDLGHGSFFKKFHYEGRHQPVIKDSVFFLEEDCYSGCKDWPDGTVAENVTVVWQGQGEFPMSILPGMTLTTDRSVWENAAANWKQRHGCTTIDQPCTRLHDPLPF